MTDTGFDRLAYNKRWHRDAKEGGGMSPLMIDTLLLLADRGTVLFGELQADNAHAISTLEALHARGFVQPDHPLHDRVDSPWSITDTGRHEAQARRR